MNRSTILGLGAALIAALLAGCSPHQTKAPAAGTALMPIRFATDWHAEAEHGGFYEALATGEYRKRGLDVTIIQGGPAVNVPLLLASGAVDMGVGSNSFIVLNLAREHAPVKAVAAFMQKDPQVLIAHPDQGIASFADMKGRPILISDAAITSFWPWLRAKFGFTDDQIRKYTHSNATFLGDPRAIQEGYLTSEPYTIEKEGHIQPAVFLLADAGYPGYAAMALATDSLIAAHPAGREGLRRRLGGRLEDLPVRRSPARRRLDPAGQPGHDAGCAGSGAGQDAPEGHHRRRRRQDRRRRRHERPALGPGVPIRLGGGSLSQGDGL